MSRTVATDQVPAAPAESTHTGQDQRNSEVVAGGSPKRYLSVRWNFVLSLTFALAWLGISMWISLPWIAGLAGVIALGPAVVVVSLLAFVPGLIINRACDMPTVIRRVRNFLRVAFGPAFMEEQRDGNREPLSERAAELNLRLAEWLVDRHGPHMKATGTTLHRQFS